MEQFVVDFRNRAQLQDIWRKNYSSGTGFVPAAKCPAVHAELTLLLKIPELSFSLLLPARVIQILPGTGGKMSGMVLEFLGFATYRAQVEDLLPQISATTGMKDFTAFAKLKGLDASEIKPLIQKARLISDGYQRKDFYKVLGIERTAPRKEIRDRYFELTKLFHPDYYAEDEFSEDVRHLLEEAYQKISQAYEVLRDEAKRNTFDLAQGHLVRRKDDSEKDFKDKQARYLHDRYREQNSENIRRAEHLYSEAMRAVKTGDVKSAMATIKIALSFDPKNPDFKKKLKELEQLTEHGAKSPRH